MAWPGIGLSERNGPPQQPSRPHEKEGVTLWANAYNQLKAERRRRRARRSAAQRGSLTTKKPETSDENEFCADPRLYRAAVREQRGARQHRTPAALYVSRASPVDQPDRQHDARAPAPAPRRRLHVSARKRQHGAAACVDG